MPRMRLVNRSANKSKQAIANEASRDLRQLAIARRRANQLGTTPTPRHLSESINNRKELSSSDDSDVEVEPRTKVSRVLPNKAAIKPQLEDDVRIIGEFSGRRSDPHLQLNLASDEATAQNGYNGQDTNNTLNNDIYENRVSSPSSTVNLVEFLKGEITVEKQNHLNLSGQNEPKISGFEILVKEQAEVKLVRKIGGEHVQILFNTNNTLYLPSEEADSTISIPALVVEILKETSRLCFNIILEKVNDSFDIRIESFYHLNIGRNEPNPVASKNELGVYQSAMQNCPAQLNAMLCNFLRDRGLTQNFCKELINYATFLEHGRYLDLLRKTKKFVESL